MYFLTCNIERYQVIILTYYNLKRIIWNNSKILLHHVNEVWLGSFSPMYSGVYMFNSTFNNISVISWRSILLAEETEVPRENHRPVGNHWQTLSHNVISSTPRHAWDSNFRLIDWYLTSNEQFSSYIQDEHNFSRNLITIGSRPRRFLPVYSNKSLINNTYSYCMYTWSFCGG